MHEANARAGRVGGAATGRAGAGAPGLAPDGADFRALFAAAPGAYLVLRADAPRFPIAAASDAYLAATHLTLEDALGRGVFEVLSDANPANAEPSGVANLRASLETVLRTGAPHRMAVQRYDLRRPDGTWEERYWAPHNVPVCGPAGDVRYVLHHVEDVTAAVRGRETREALARAERGAAAVLDRIADAYLVLDRDFRVVDVNPAAERSMRKTRAELLGRSHWEVFPASHDIDAGRHYRRAAREGVELHFTEHYRYEGYDVHLEMSAYPTDAGGVAVFWRDVTARVRAEAERERLLAASEAARAALEQANAQLRDQQLELELANQQLQEQAAELEAQAEALQATAAELEERTEAADRARAEAEAANRAKGDFLAVMSHELRTPLNAIGGYAQLMELGLQGPVTPDQLTALGRIQRGQQHLLGLINAVLNYAKLEAGHVRYETADVPAAELLAEAAALVAPQARAKGLALQVAPCPPDLVARADGEKAGQVLLNLLSNAVKFTRGGGALTVAGARAPGGRVALTVADTGRGIPAAQLARVFEPFVQVDQRLTRAEEGTGLGLAISRDLARGMGGDLTAESTPGVGSRFTLTLPAA